MTQEHKAYLLCRARVYFGMGRGAMDDTTLHHACYRLQDIADEFSSAGLPIFSGYVTDYIDELTHNGRFTNK